MYCGPTVCPAVLVIYKASQDSSDFVFKTKVNIFWIHVIIHIVFDNKDEIPG